MNMKYLQFTSLEIALVKIICVPEQALATKSGLQDSIILTIEHSKIAQTPMDMTPF